MEALSTVERAPVHKEDEGQRERYSALYIHTYIHTYSIMYYIRVENAHANSGAYLAPLSFSLSDRCSFARDLLAIAFGSTVRFAAHTSAGVHTDHSNARPQLTTICISHGSLQERILRIIRTLLARCRFAKSRLLANARKECFFLTFSFFCPSRSAAHTEKATDMVINSQILSLEGRTEQRRAKT